MAASCAASVSADEGCEALLLSVSDDAVHVVVDYKGHPFSRSNTGGWRAAGFIIGMEITERIAYYGIESNLISYLTGPLQQSLAIAAANVNTWSGAASMLPLLGALVADAWLGRYRTIIFSSLLYILGLGLLTLSAVLPSHSASNCHGTSNSTSCRPPQFQIIFFFFSLYLVALAQGGHKPSVQAFGADQFNVRDPQECKSRSSFFNWWYFGMCVGVMFTIWILSYIQDNLSWGLGFGIPCITMAVGLIVYLLGTKTYRYSFNEAKNNPLMRIVQVFVAAAKNWRIDYSPSFDKEGGETLPPGANQFKFLDKALAKASDGSKKEWAVCSVDQVEDAKAVLRLVPIWTTCLAYAVVFAQPPTFFTKQGASMDRSIGSGLEIPAASIQTIISLSIVIFIPIYDRIIVPVARFFTKRHSGITMLQRIGTGMLLSLVAMVVAALVEKKRLQIAIDYDLVDKPHATVPMSVWWLIPQSVLLGVANVFTMVGLQEFFYDQFPDGLRSLGLSLYLSIFGVGSFLSSFLVSAIEKATGGDGQDSWFSNNLNRAHLDYFYWLLTGLSAVQLAFYLYFAKSYLYNTGRTI